MEPEIEISPEEIADRLAALMVANGKPKTPGQAAGILYRLGVLNIERLIEITDDLDPFVEKQMP